MNVRSLSRPALAVFLAALAAACSSNGPDGGSHGALLLSLTASAGTSQPAGDGALGRLQAAKLTISSVEARALSGSWVVLDTGLPVTVDLVSILKESAAAELPADLIPEGSYQALNVMISTAALSLQDGTLVELTPPGTGWSALLPVNFTVVAGQATTIELNVQGENSFRVLNGEFEFDPALEVQRVKRTSN